MSYQETEDYYKRVVDDNKRLRELVKRAYTEGINIADKEFNDRDFVHRDTDKTKAEFWDKSEVKKEMEDGK